jgi:hypothetical protein
MSAGEDTTVADTVCASKSTLSGIGRRGGRDDARRTPYSVSEQDLSLPPIMKFQQQQQQTHSDSSKMNILLILRKSENKRSI